MYDMAENGKLEWLSIVSILDRDCFSVSSFQDVKVFKKIVKIRERKQNSEKRKKMEEKSVSELIGFICAFACYFL